MAGAELAVDVGGVSEHEGAPEHVEQSEGGVQAHQGRASQSETCGSGGRELRSDLSSLRTILQSSGLNGSLRLQSAS